MLKHLSLRTPQARNLIIFSSLIMIVFCVVVAYQASKAYEAAVEEGKVNSERLIRIISDHVELTFLSVDLTLRRGVEGQYFNTLFGGNLPEYLEQNFRIWVSENPQIASMLLINDEGVVEVAAHKKGYEKWMDYSHNFKNDKMFQLMKNGNDRQLFIGTYATSLQNGSGNLIIIARKLIRLDGTFGGIVLAAMDPAYFVNFYRSVELGSRSYVSLMENDGTPLVAGPNNGTAERSIVAYIYDEMQQMQQGESSQVTRIHTDSKIISDTQKIFSYRMLKNLPIIVSIIIDEEDFLRQWRSARVKDVGFLAIFTIFGSVLSFFAITMAKQIKRVEDSESAAVLANQAKSEFLANMSHELRTPLNAIIGFSEMMSAGYFGPLNAKQKERVHDINLCGNHLLQLITDILEFSKGEAGKLELLEDKVDISDIVNESLRIMNEKIKNKKITTTVDLQEHLPQLWADKRKVRQIMLNLLSNAVKFSPENAKIHISAWLDHHQNLRLTVADTGIGIAEEDIPRALSVFGQVHRSQSHEGTGLGLPLCKMFVELHGGKLQLESVVGEGTTVRLTFPAERVLFGNEG
jgi:signal transduction histidine kinase